MPDPRIASIAGGLMPLTLALMACPQGSYLPDTDTLIGTTGSGPSTSSEPTATSDPTTGSEPPPCNTNGVCDQGESALLCPDECKACGNGEIDDGEVCDEGEANSKDNAYHEGSPETAPCNSSCSGKVDFCGDGTCQLNEDAINCTLDGCMPACGNGVMEAGEDCDDGNLDNEDACLNNCAAASCGDGFIEVGVEDCDDTNLADNDACTNACKMAICGDGLTWAGNEDCDDANVDDTDACDTACKTVVHRKVFVSSAAYNGNLQGLAGADDRCQALATSAGFPGMFKAWLSDSSTGPADRFDTSFTGVYELVDGTTVAHGWADLTGGTLQHAIDVTEENSAVDATVWSNTDTSGAPKGGTHCSDWNTSSSMAEGLIGLTSSADSSWTDGMSSGLCSLSKRIYCFEDPA